MANATQKVTTPIGDLKWVFITGKGKKDLNDNDRFVASVSYPADSLELAKIKQEIEDFWTANKPKGKKQKSNSIKEEFDQEGEPTGNFLVNFWTGTTFPDGKAKVIKVYNARNTIVDLGTTRIGNSSRGCVSGTMAIYNRAEGAGVTIYLNALQVTKLVEYDDNAGFSSVADEDGWTGENADGFSPASDDSGTGTDPVIDL